MQQRFADARRASALRAVARTSARKNGKNGKNGRILGIFRRRGARDVDVHEFRPQGEDVWKAIRF
jgi:hypothetical protein